ncbi:MAG: bifunctional ornithine acetyltransferase/N-acetylglutamate synthase, partial [Eubacteriales bacterium]
KTKADARILAKAVAASALVKTAMYGSDANWGRVICALGYSGADIDTSKIDISFESSAGVIDVCKNGGGYPFDEDTAKKILSEDKIRIICSMNDGEYSAEAYGCDLSYEYVRINGDYRS